MPYIKTRNTSKSISRDARYRAAVFFVFFFVGTDTIYPTHLWLFVTRIPQKDAVLYFHDENLNCLFVLFCQPSARIQKKHVLCSCFPLSVSALQSVLPIGVWRAQRCYYVTTQLPGAVAIFKALFSGRRDNRVTRGGSPRTENPQDCIQSPLSYTLP